MSPGAPARPGSITVMKNDNTYEEAVALAQEYLEILRLAEDAPASPVSTFAPAKLRRALRRDAARLRQGQTEPRYKNLHSAGQLAAIYERTAQRDEMFEKAVKDFRRITRNLDRIRQENPAGLQKAMEALVLEAQRSAEEQGPGSEAARRYRNVLRMAWLGSQRHTQCRRQRAPVPRPLDMAPDPSVEARYELSAAEILTSLSSPEEAVIAFPPDGTGSGGERMFIRIGTGERSWVGSFERGRATASIITMMPGDKHLFVSADGAAYIIELESRTLVEAIGTEVEGVLVDEPPTLFVVDHDGRSLEAFGTTGRLWKTPVISGGGFRRMALTDAELLGEARYPSLRTWVRFSVQLATGDVELR